MTLDDLERRIQGQPKVLKYPLLSQELVNLRISNFIRTFIGSIEKKPIKNFGNRSRGRSQELRKIFRALKA